jgi:AcrR family transcriptional regulator
MEMQLDWGRRQRKRQELHDTLLETAESLFREQGVNGTTIDDIAATADVARQTVFNHFPYKEAIALELAADGVEDISHRAHALLEAGTDALAVLDDAAQKMLDFAVHEGELAVTVARELLHPDPERVERARRHVPLEDIFHAILVQAREEGVIREDLPLGLVASRLSSTVTFLLAQVRMCEVERLRTDLSLCFDIVLNGIMKRSA